MKIAGRLRDIEPFRVVEVLTRAKALEASGQSIVHLEAGEPDFVTAEPIVEAAKRALDQGWTGYSQATGIPELKRTLSHWYQDRYGLNIAPERILITPGASGALLLIASLLIDPGEGLLMADPGYPCNRNFLRLVEGEGQLVPCDASTRYQLTADNAAAAWRDNTRGVMVASPANPTGEILSRDELEALAAVCRERDGALIVDEIYHGLDYDSRACSVLEVEPEAFVLNSFSKYFGMTGWRLGWLVAPEWAVEPSERLAQNLFISMSTHAQYGALAAFEDRTLETLEQRKRAFQDRRDYLFPELQQLGFGIPRRPAGAFYLYADCSELTDSASRLASELLSEAGVAVTPGIDFGRHRNDQHIRFAYTTGMPQLEDAVARLKRFLF